MGTYIRKILAAIFFLALAAGVLFIYLKMFVSSVPETDESNRPRPSGFTFSDEPSSISTSRTPIATTPKSVSASKEPTSSKPAEVRNITGTVLDFDSGNPIPSFAVMLLGLETNYFAESLSGNDGVFSFPDLPLEEGDNFILRVAQAGYYLSDQPVIVGDRITLHPVVAATLQGHITDPQSPVSISDARVSVVVSWDNKEIPFYCTSDNRGDYSLPSLPPGIVISIVVLANPYVPAEHVPPNTQIRLRRKQAVIHNMQLVSGLPVSGLVKNKDGDTLVGALVFLVAKDDSFTSPRSEEMRSKFYYLAYTDDKGRFSMPPAPVDGTSYEIVIYFEGYKVTRKTWDEKTSEIDLEEGDDPHPLFAPQP